MSYDKTVRNRADFRKCRKLADLNDRIPNRLQTSSKRISGGSSGEEWFFKGYRPQLSSSSNAFAKRGDPWVTKREGEEGYDRQVEIENPDMDADRQRNARLEGLSKELRDRVKPDFDFKMTMREAIETERSTSLDGYQAKKAKPEA
jgi:hypothetical protein